MAKSIATARKGAKVIGIGAVDVRKIESLEKAVERTVKELGGIDFVMFVLPFRMLASIYTEANYITEPEQQEISYLPYRPSPRMLSGP